MGFDRNCSIDTIAVKERRHYWNVGACFALQLYGLFGLLLTT